eukprot:NODE_5871_length_630_cov_36.800344_g5474_i0.p1 GENE.NODE_5871_length_630_cov_36.800344_g5474_i0~~NODE_5871_length_630_cov_36.800344_g5474_i0.p1  ORF type:complete len:172 (+),score=72.08 NODE_5871_length_630_cov_36.800344_g5474_i0:54-518(+)
MNGFFGIAVEPEKKYKQTPPGGVHLHLSQAALPLSAKGRVTLNVTIDGSTFCLCTLVGGAVQQWNLDLNFSGSREIVFATEGDPIIVHLTGYYEISDEMTGEQIDEGDSDEAPEREEEAAPHEPPKKEEPAGMDAEGSEKKKKKKKKPKVQGSA